MPNEFSVAMTGEVNDILLRHLIREDDQEDLCFALYNPSTGDERQTALMCEPVLPEEGDRQVHGNASFNVQYFERVCRLAMERNCGVVFLHSHPFPGWQEMSSDDVRAEQRIAGSTLSLTDLPLVGMTVGDEGTWSARFWTHSTGREFERNWCVSVRVVGERLKVHFADQVLPRPAFREMFKRTATVWGPKNHTDLARLRIGIVGLGSVGSILAETLSRMGFGRIVLIDFDEVQEHNLDRLLGAGPSDIGELKIDIAEREIRKTHTAAKVDVRKIPYSIVEPEGYGAALDCDVLFSSVDRPRPRYILNHMAYSHLIPVIDGGIAVRFRNEKFAGVDWQLQTVGPGRPCLSCLGVVDHGDVATETEGKLDDATYMQGLANEHHLKQNENVFPFSANLASLEVLHLVALATGIAGIADFGVQRYRYNPGIVDQDVERSCKEHCDFVALVAEGDKHFTLSGRDLGAERARERQKTKRE